VSSHGPDHAWLSRIPELLPAAVVVARGRDGTVLYANRRLGTLLEVLPDDARGRPLDELLGASDALATLTDAVDRGNGVGEVELRGRCPNGDELWLIGAVCRETVGDEPDALVMMVRDGSLRRRLEAEVVTLAELPEMNPGPVCRLDAAGTVILANAAARSLFAGGDLVGASWLDVCPGMTRDTWAAVLASERPVTHEAQVGEVAVLFTHVCREPRDSVFAFGADITERRTAERRLADQAAQLAEVARFPDMNPGPVIRTDTAGTVLMDNVAARAVLGDCLVGRSWLEVCPEVDESVWRTILGSSEPVPLETVLDDRVYVFTHRSDPDSALVFVYGADVTLQRQAESALRQSEKMATLGTLVAGVAHELNNPAAATSRAADQLRDVFSRFEEAQLGLHATELPANARELLRALEEQARLHAGRPDAFDALARSDLESAVEGWLEERAVDDPWELAPALVSQGLDAPELSSLADALPDDAVVPVVTWAAYAYPVYSLLYEIGEGSTRISELVRALKNYSFLGQAPVQEIDVHEGLDNTLVILRSKLKDGIRVHRDYCTNMPRIRAFGSELNQVWTNLIDNAVDAMDGKGSLTIRTRFDDGFGVIEIEDDGPGIPAELQAQVFDPFFTTKDPGRGTGLGLATTYSVIVDKHHGTITVDSAPGRTVFTVRLPGEGVPEDADATGDEPAA
jgi:signal transduction histidine kinase